MFGLNPYSIALKVAIGLMVAALAAFVMHRIDSGTISDLKLSIAQGNLERTEAANAALQHDAKIISMAAVGEATAQQQIVTQTLTTANEVTHYVKDTSTCITWGLVRVLDAAATGVGPADLPLPAGQSDDACAPIGAAALAGSVVRNYGAARQNAEQLNRLIGTVTQLAPVAGKEPAHARP